MISMTVWAALTPLALALVLDWVRGLGPSEFSLPGLPNRAPTPPMRGCSVHPTEIERRR